MDENEGTENCRGRDYLKDYIAIVLIALRGAVLSAGFYKCV